MIARGLALALVLVTLCLAAASAFAVAPRASLTDIESQVMCTTCGVPLSIAESPQAERERAFIRRLIARGETPAQIKQALVVELGPGVLALPERRGFALAAYIVPIALIALLSVALAIALPRWRRRGRHEDDDGDDHSEADELSPEDAARLDAELARYPG